MICFGREPDVQLRHGFCGECACVCDIKLDAHLAVAVAGSGSAEAKCRVRQAVAEGEGRLQRRVAIARRHALGVGDVAVPWLDGVRCRCRQHDGQAACRRVRAEDDSC